jgi:hypothetical protein
VVTARSSGTRARQIEGLVTMLAEGRTIHPRRDSPGS